MGWDFLAFGWAAADAAASSQARDLSLRLGRSEAWRRAWRGEGLEVWSRSGRPAPAAWRPDEACLVIGRFHERSRGPKPAEQEAGWAGRLCAAGWGAYAALGIEARSGALEVFRDPTGAQDVLTWRSGRLSLVGSDLLDLPVGLLPKQLALDWDVIAGWVRRPLSTTGRLALSGVSPLAPGDLRRIGADGRSDDIAVWRPADWAGRADTPGRDWAAELRESAEAVVRQATAPHELVLAQVSGGFDSTLVANLAAAAGARVTAVTFHGDRPEGDERAWARAACAPRALPLSEMAKTLTPWTEADFALSARCARPSLNALDAEQDRQTADLLGELGAGALLTGQGGDPVFYQMPSALPLADLRDQLGPAALWNPFTGARARELRRSVWSVWREAASARAGRSPSAEPMAAFLGPRAWAAPARPAHRWLEGLEAAPPGKRFQIENLVGAQASWGRARRAAAAELIQPLLAQPLVELAMSIPSWRLLEDGRERGLARRAFVDVVPEVVLARRAKGDLTSFYTRLVAASLPALRPHLLDGVLVGAQVLDRAAVEAALDEDRLLWRGDGLHLLGCAVIESWVRYWQGQAWDAPGAGRRRAAP